MAHHSANSGRSNSESISTERLFGNESATNCSPSAAVGGNPSRSSMTRRMKVASSQTGDGLIFRVFSLVKTSSSMKLAGVGPFQMKSGRSGTKASRTAACWFR